MALTQVSTGGVKDDAITKAKIPANQIEASELADNAVDTNAIADNAVSSVKIPANAVTQAKIADDAVGADQLASNAVVTASIADNAITQAKINVPISNRNLIINGAMLVAQRSTDITTGNAGVHCVDRIDGESSNADEAPRRQQVDVSSSSTPYTLGFRKAFKLTNGNQTSGAGADDIMNIRYNIESQDIVNSGWNYKSASSFVTLQFWIKSSVSQNFNIYLRTRDGTNQTYAFDTGTLSADTWTKITKTISGNANIQLDNDNGQGLQINFGPFWGTNRTSSSVVNEVWQGYNSASRMKDNATTWYTTDNATLEITGLQLEVGSVATDFEHRSFGQELALCQRYFQEYTHSTHRGVGGFCGRKSGSSTVVGAMYGFPPMRAAATGSVDNLGAFKMFRYSDGTTSTPTAVGITHQGSVEPFTDLKFTFTVSSFASTGNMCGMFTTASSGKLTLDAEL